MMMMMMIIIMGRVGYLMQTNGMKNLSGFLNNHTIIFT